MKSMSAGVFGFLAGLLFWLLILAVVPPAAPTVAPAVPAVAPVVPAVAPTDPAGAPAVPADANIFDAIKTCVKDPADCLKKISGRLSKLSAYGAILGLFGLLIQLGLRGEWPRGQLNVDRPKVLDPKALVTVVIAAMIAGISIASFLPGKVGVLGIVAFGYLAADAATLGVDKISDLAEKFMRFFKKQPAAK